MLKSLPTALEGIMKETLYRGHRNPPHPHTSELISFNELNCSEEAQLCLASCYITFRHVIISYFKFMKRIVVGVGWVCVVPSISSQGVGTSESRPESYSQGTQDPARARAAAKYFSVQPIAHARVLSTRPLAEETNRHLLNKSSTAIGECGRPGPGQEMQNLDSRKCLVHRRNCAPGVGNGYPILDVG
jgi:hypothetical protein